MSFVTFQGIIHRPMLTIPMSREEVIAELRAALGRRIARGTWGTGVDVGVDEEGEDSDE